MKPVEVANYYCPEKQTKQGATEGLANMAHQSIDSLHKSAERPQSELNEAASKMV